ncbi:hypothetical protein A3A68_02650 [Candidatus Saccharibacteria bacterium RIFCSPLOWO2_01_FULL_48_13]|nr:MAG: hypothetical protein A2884_01700 [Candidatus Saccharibacteria bacterium RIFCSPHIGHO2_01_FULL_48_12]OGL36462.1 MAG: hypothetical protein A3F38_00835 [Candidatus Saccharibacteria bacterium RIFCSPHIGHO2_12_FULL_48_21]OGL37504.1 MAG: hypothetical protein A3A68_02650 [Candidatus Saccharibacteria bacterium RIFCSPLOWO2_01_FULL_48_13]
MSRFCQVWLTVGDKDQADKIASVLLAKQLVACVRQIPTSSDFRWKGKVEHSDEIILLMESSLELFENIEEEVTKLHKYDTFVLEATPISSISKSAQKWLKDELKNV